MSKQKSLILLKMLMGILNFAILTFLAVIILYTIGMVRATYTARSFLNHITYLPMNPVKTVIVMYVALFTLVAIINLRQQSENSILNQTIYILEVILCGIIICCVYMEYKGIIFLVIADIVVLIRDKTSQKVFLVIMGLIYIFADYDIISLGIKMVSFQELLNVYTVRQHMLMTGILNFFSSVNAIAFIAYMIIYMRSQIKEKERVTILNQQLAEANVQLSEMNNQLKDYAANAESFLKATDEMAKKIVAEHPECNLFITLGQGINYGIANECMNKMKEMSLSNSEAYYTLEYRHGPMSLVDDKTLIILLGNEGTVDGDAKLLTQMKEYGAKVLAIGNNASKDFTDVDYTLDMPYGYDSLQNAPIIGYIGQLIGYYVAELKNLNADSPRHLTQAIVIK